MLTAQVQLANAQAQSTDLVRQRQALEHAIAVLAGMAPAELTIAPAPWSRITPTSVSLPSNNPVFKLITINCMPGFAFLLI